MAPAIANFAFPAKITPSNRLQAGYIMCGLYGFIRRWISEHAVPQGHGKLGSWLMSWNSWNNSTRDHSSTTPRQTVKRKERNRKKWNYRQNHTKYHPQRDVHMRIRSMNSYTLWPSENGWQWLANSFPGSLLFPAGTSRWWETLGMSLGLMLLFWKLA